MNRVLVPTALAPPAPPCAAPVRHLRGETMGTSWCVRYAADAACGPERLLAGIEARLERVTAQMSPWRAGSDLCCFNRLPAGASLVLPEAFRVVLAGALATAEATDGAFDPTIGPLVDLWGFGPVPAAGEGPPPPDRVAAARARIGWRRLDFDPASGRACQPDGLGLDLCGIAKGYAVDLVAEGLEAEGVGSYLVEIGGELRGRGVKPDGSPWWVGLERPEGEAAGDDAPRFVVALHGLAVATSGDYRRGFRHGGRSYGHTLDPRTGWPIPERIASVTVLHPRCMQADALATALSVLGLPAGLDHARRHGIAALFLARRGAGGGFEEHLSPALEAMLD
jgi:FAD:protein FMN transferase